MSISLIETSEELINNRNFDELNRCLNSLYILQNISNQTVKNKIIKLEEIIIISFDEIINNIQRLIGSDCLSDAENEINK